MATTLKEPEIPSRPTLRKKKDSPKKWLWPAIFVLILVVGFIVWERTHAANPNANLITSTVTRGNLTELVSATGSVQAQTGAMVSVGSQITGVIKKLYADVGSHVKAGQIIAELDLPDLQANYQGSIDAAVAAQYKYYEDRDGVLEEREQTKSAIDQAQQTLVADREKLTEAQQVLNEQETTTPTDIQKAQTALNAAVAGVAAARANLRQTTEGYNLQIQSAKEALVQAQANAANSAALLARNKTLYNEGYIAASAYDQAVATDKVNQSLVGAAQENVTLTEQKEADALETGNDSLNQAIQTQYSSQAALKAAQSETLTTAQKKQEVDEAAATARDQQAVYEEALGNKANDLLKDEDVTMDRNAWQQAQQQAVYNKVQVDKSYIRSPITGTVLNLAVQQGQTIAAGLAAPTLITVCDLNRLEIDAYVSETDIGKVQKGQLATCTVDSFPNQSFVGRVQKIARGSTIQQNVVTYDVTIGITDPTHLLNPDETATVNIQVANLQNVVMVPAVAVQLTTQGSTVNVLRTKDGTSSVVPVKVVTGGTDGVNTQILSGLKEGDTIVLAGATSHMRAANNPFGQSSSRSSSGGGGRGG